MVGFSNELNAEIVLKIVLLTSLELHTSLNLVKTIWVKGQWALKISNHFHTVIELWIKSPKFKKLVWNWNANKGGFDIQVPLETKTF